MTTCKVCGESVKEGEYYEHLYDHDPYDLADNVPREILIEYIMEN